MTTHTVAEAGLEPELMDRLDLPAEENGRALADLDRVHRWLFGHLAARRALLPRLLHSRGPQVLFDLGTGSGTVSAQLQREATRNGVCLQVIGIDRKIGHLLFGRRQRPRQTSVVASAEALPFRDDAGDWSFSNLLFHHFSAAQNRRILAEMQRISRRGSVIVDLRQAHIARVLVRLLLPLLRVGPVARFDGRVSADQAWKMRNLSELTRDLPVAELRRRFPFRFSLVLQGTDSRELFRNDTVGIG